MTEKKVFQFLKTSFRGQNDLDTNGVMNTPQWPVIISSACLHAPPCG